MYHQIANWLDNVLSQCIPEDVIAFGFNLYDDEDNRWSMELVGTNSFDRGDADWCCDEATDFGTREKPFTWEENAAWDNILEKITLCLKEYLENGKYADVLKDKNGIGVGFVDGDLEIIYTK